MAAVTPDVLGRLKYPNAPTTISVSGTSARNSADLPEGIYELTCDTEAFFLQGSSSVTALTTSNPLWSKSYRLFHVDGTANARIALITTGATGTAYIVSRAG